MCGSDSISHRRQCSRHPVDAVDDLRSRPPGIHRSLFDLLVSTSLRGAKPTPVDVRNDRSTAFRQSDSQVSAEIYDQPPEAILPGRIITSPSSTQLQISMLGYSSVIMETPFLKKIIFLVFFFLLFIKKARSLQVILLIERSPLPLCVHPRLALRHPLMLRAPFAPESDIFIEKLSSIRIASDWRKFDELVINRVSRASKNWWVENNIEMTIEARGTSKKMCLVHRATLLAAGMKIWGLEDSSGRVLARLDWGVTLFPVGPCWEVGNPRAKLCYERLLLWYT